MTINQHTHETTIPLAPRLALSAGHRGHRSVVPDRRAHRGLAPFPQPVDTWRSGRRRTQLRCADRAVPRRRGRARRAHDPVRGCRGVSGRGRAYWRPIAYVPAAVAQVPEHEAARRLQTIVGSPVVSTANGRDQDEAVSVSLSLRPGWGNQGLAPPGRFSPRRRAEAGSVKALFLTVV